MRNLLWIAVLGIGLTACATMQGPTAVANMSAISGSSATGTVKFTELSDGSVRVDVALTNVPPGVHGFHIHEKGDCGDNGNAAGGHFNPRGNPHGSPSDTAHHAGDFGNVSADSTGVVNTSFTTRAISISPGTASAVGRAVVLHGSPDDLTSQPSGNAGPRISCGIVQLAGTGGA